jgi:hypothetical protein
LCSVRAYWAQATVTTVFTKAKPMALKPFPMR